jgi:hypothetical protein
MKYILYYYFLFVSSVIYSVKLTILFGQCNIEYFMKVLIQLTVTQEYFVQIRPHMEDNKTFYLLFLAYRKECLQSDPLPVLFLWEMYLFTQSWVTFFLVKFN